MDIYRSIHKTVYVPHVKDFSILMFKPSNFPFPLAVTRLSFLFFSEFPVFYIMLASFIIVSVFNLNQFCQFCLLRSFVIRVNF